MRVDAPASLRPTDTDTPSEALEKLRQEFHLRLQDEMSRLIGFIAQARAPRARDGHASLGVSMFAHRLHGAALVFEYPQVAAAAKSMELAVAAAGAQAPVAELVEEAMQALLEQLRLATSASPAMPREHSGFQLVRAPVLPPVTETRGPGHMGVPVGGWSGTTPTR